MSREMQGRGGRPSGGGGGFARRSGRVDKVMMIAAPRQASLCRGCVCVCAVLSGGSKCHGQDRLSCCWGGSQARSKERRTSVGEARMTKKDKNGSAQPQGKPPKHCWPFVCGVFGVLPAKVVLKSTEVRRRKARKRARTRGRCSSFLHAPCPHTDCPQTLAPSLVCGTRLLQQLCYA